MRVVVLLAFLVGCAPDATKEPLTVFAAASMTDVAADLADAFESETGVPVVVSTGASSTLARQIAAGAPADVVLLVGEEWPPWLVSRGHVEDLTIVAEGAMAVGIPSSSAEWSRLGEIAEVERVALADPAHVPAGVFARDLLTRAGLWEEVEPHIVSFPNVRAALAAVESGNADAAIVYATDLRVSPRVKAALEISSEVQPVVSFRCGVVAGEGSVRVEESRRFCEAAAEQEAIWLRRGFQIVRTAR